MLALIALVVFCPFIFAFPPAQDLPERCGSHPTNQQIEAAKTQYDAKLTSSTVRTAEVGAVQVYWHVITSGDAYEQGNIPNGQVEDSIAVLNHAFAPSGLWFTLANITRTENSRWFFNASLGNGIQTQMKNQLRVGDGATLNVYTVRLRRYLGYATFPWNYEDQPLDDGVVLRYSTLPGGASSPYNRGMQLVHEVGHWVGLYHTFQGGCVGEGDMVSDTPPSDSPSSGCPIGKDSCPGGDPDLVNNYMDYSDDDCLDSFTPGQITRLKDQIRVFRDIGC